MANVTVMNLGTSAQSIEFINNLGNHDSITIPARSTVQIDEESITTSKENLAQRRLVIK